MKYEERSEIATLLVEPTDEKASLVRWVNNQSQPVVVVLPEHAAIRRPGDLLELKRASSHQHGSITLVITGNEPLRSWARRQGFSAYSSPESCAKALVQRRMTQPLLKQETEPHRGKSMSRNTPHLFSLYSHYLKGFVVKHQASWEELVLATCSRSRIVCGQHRPYHIFTC